jgi:hypothetical protein
MYQYRVTKYDPTFRDERGGFTLDEWTSLSDIGKQFENTTLTSAEYDRVETAYIETAIMFLREAGIESLTVCGLENHRHRKIIVSEGLDLPLEELKQPFREVLREQYWCRFEKGDDAFVHFGYDYYMYIGIPSHSQRASLFAKGSGLFVEYFESPYRCNDDG